MNEIQRAQLEAARSALAELEDAMLSPERIVEIFQENSERYRMLDSQHHPLLAQVDKAVAQHPLVPPSLLNDLDEKGAEAMLRWALDNVMAPSWILNEPEHVVRRLFTQWNELLVVHIDQSLQAEMFLRLTADMGTKPAEKAAVNALRAVARRDGVNAAYEAYSSLRSAEKTKAQLAAEILENVMRVAWPQQIAHTVRGFFNIVRERDGALQAAVSTYQYAVHLCASLGIPAPPAIYQSLL